MGLFSGIGRSLGTIAGGVGGFLLGGPTGAAIGAGLGSGFDNRNAQVRTNQQNIALAREQMKFQANERIIANQFATDQVREAREFEKEMSNTAVQRAAADMEAAGLHRSLATGGASTPSTSAPSGSVSSGAAPHLQAPTIHLPDLFAMGVSLKQLELADKKLTIEGEKAAANITKTLSDKDLNKMKEVLLKRGMPRAHLEGEAAGILQQLIRMVKDAARKPQMPNPQPQ